MEIIRGTTILAPSVPGLLKVLGQLLAISHPLALPDPRAAHEIVTQERYYAHDVHILRLLLLTTVLGIRDQAEQNAELIILLDSARMTRHLDTPYRQFFVPRSYTLEQWRLVPRVSEHLEKILQSLAEVVGDLPLCAALMPPRQIQELLNGNHPLVTASRHLLEPALSPLMDRNYIGQGTTIERIHAEVSHVRSAVQAVQMMADSASLTRYYQPDSDCDSGTYTVITLSTLAIIGAIDRYEEILYPIAQRLDWLDGKGSIEAPISELSEKQQELEALLMDMETLPARLHQDPRNVDVVTRQYHLESDD